MQIDDEQIDPLAIALPTRLAEYLTPKMFGVRAKFHADPWIMHLEREVVGAALDRSKEDFIAANAPPQSGKSTFLEVFFPLWYLGHHPETRIILIAYNDTLAQKSGAFVRDYMTAYGPKLFNLTVDPKYDAKGEWRLDGHVGGMLSVGIGSSVTGQSGDIIIIGDVLKNMQEAASQTTKNMHWDEYHGTIKTRLQPGGTIVLGATRFADDDLTGRLKAQQREPEYDGDRYEFTNFPALAEPDDDEEVDNIDEWRDVIGRRFGEPLRTRFWRKGDDEEWEKSWFHRVKRTTSPIAWAALYMGNPTAVEGGMFPPDKWGTFDPNDRPSFIDICRSWDLATQENAGDWTVGAKVGKDADGRIYVLDVVRFRKSSEKVMAEVKVRGQTDGVGVPILIERERNGAGRSNFNFYKNAVPNNLVIPSEPDGKKHERWHSYSVHQQEGRVLLPEGASWITEFVDEHRKAMADGRKGRWDDQIDAVAYAVIHMLDASVAEMVDPNLYVNDALARRVAALLG